MIVKKNNGIMQIIDDTNVSKEKMKILISGIEELIKIDKNNNDLKSMEFHKMALENAKNNIKKMEV